MKKLKSILLILVFSSFFFGFTHVDKRHIGKWQYNEDGEVGTFIFQENGYALMIMDGDTLGGESYLIDGEEYSLKYFRFCILKILTTLPLQCILRTVVFG